MSPDDFGSLDGSDWQDVEAQQNLRAIQAAKPRTWGDWWRSAGKVLPNVGGALNAMATTQGDIPLAGAEPETFVNPLVSGLLKAGGEAIGSGVTAPGEAAAGKIPQYDAEGHTSPEMISRAFDTAALAGGGAGLETAGRETLPQVASDTARSGGMIADADKLRELANQRRARGWATGKSAEGWNFRRPEPEPGTPERAAAEEAARQQAAKEPPQSALMSPDDWDFISGGSFYSDTAKPGAAVAAAEHATPFYSPTERALGEIEAKQLSGNGWINQLKRYGAKPEEMDHIGLTDALKARGDKPVLKQEVEQHLNENRVELHGEDKQSWPRWEELSDKQKQKLEDHYFGETQGQRYVEPGEVEDWYERAREQPGGMSNTFPNASRYDDYVLPSSMLSEEPLNYRERVLRLPPMRDAQGNITGHEIGGPNYKSTHWDEPNVIVHRRTSDRTFPEAFTPEEQAQNDAREAGLQHVQQLQAQQGAVGRQIRAIAQPLDQQRRAWIMSDMQSGRISPAEGRRRLEAYADHPELKPLQDRLQELRQQESDARAQIPEEIPPKSVKSMHLEELQSDLHQQGREHGYMQPGDRTLRLHEKKPVPDLPWKDSWPTLGVRDAIREAAENGYKRISWTAGEEQPTNPLVMMADQGRRLRDMPAADQPRYLKADAGLRSFYNERLVNIFNKAGKPHGVSVQEGKIANYRGASGQRIMDALGIPEAEQEAGYWSNLTHAQREQLRQDYWDRGTKVYHMEIPDSLRDEALKKGFSLFEDSGQGAKAIAGAEHVTEPTAAGARAAGSDVAGGAGRGNSGLEEAARASARRAGAHQPLPGLPAKAMKIGDEYFVPGPIASVKDVADSYMAGRNPLEHSMQFPDRYHDLEPERSRAIARAFDEMKHDPDNPKVKAAYDAMISETRDQFRHAMKSGLKIEPITPEMADPYALNPRLAAKDVGDNNHLWFFPTEQGFGSSPEAGIDMRTHPMMQPSGETLNGRPLLNNDLFRVVHDYFGHLKEGYGFRAAGEDNAWRSHAAMYSDKARPAMTSETRGQNSWVNYGPHGETNRKASAADTHYADQKVGVMPDWTMDPGKFVKEDALAGKPVAIASKADFGPGGELLKSKGTAKARAAANEAIASTPKGFGPMDISAQEGPPLAPQRDLPRHEPPRGVSERMQRATSNPDVAQGLDESIAAGRHVANWYHTEPVRQEFIKHLGEEKGQQGFAKFMDLIAATSPQSDVPTNIRNASHYYVGGRQAVEQPNPYPYGHKAQLQHKRNVAGLEEGGWDPYQNPKPASFSQNLQGNQEPVTVDTHAFRNIGMRTRDPEFLMGSHQDIYKPGADPVEDALARRFGEVGKNTKGQTVIRYNPKKLYKEGKLTLEEAQNIPRFWAAQPNPNEYGAAEKLYKQAAARAGLRPAEAQAAAWSGAGEMTGLGTVGTHTFPELMNERIMFTSYMRGESPTKVLKDFVTGKKPLLSNPTRAGLPRAIAHHAREDQQQ